MPLGKTSPIRVLPSGDRFSVESIKAISRKCFDQRHTY